MVFKRIFIISCLSFFFVSSAFSQTYLSFGVNGVSHEDTLYIGDTINFNFWIVNQSTLLMTDSLSINCETFDDAGVSIAAMPIGNYYNTTLAPGDSLFVTISEIVSYQSYVLGDNIVVIWPAAVGGGTVDTSFTHLHVLDSVSATGFNERFVNHEVLFYPNPVDQNVIFFNSVYPISDMQIVDIFGRVVACYEDVYVGPSNISLHNLSKGVYFIRMNVKRKRVVHRIFIQ